MDPHQSLLNKIREKQASDVPKPTESKEALLQRIQEKKAQDPIAVIDRLATENLKQESMGDIGKTALMSLGLGTAARGGYGLLNLLRRNISPLRVRSKVKPLPLPYPEEEEEEKIAAEGVMAPPGGESWFDSPVTKKEGLWWRKPGMLLGGLAGAYGGWKLVDHIMDQRRQSEVEDEVSGAKQNFRGAMMSNFASPIKQASDNSDNLGSDLDRVFDAFEKQATIGDTIGSTVGNYGMYAVPASLLAGYSAYNMARKRRRSNVLKKALQRRERRRQQQSPAPIFATPVPVKIEKEEEEQALA
jgi:hypothetical protein